MKGIKGKKKKQRHEYDRVAAIRTSSFFFFLLIIHGKPFEAAKKSWGFWFFPLYPRFFRMPLKSASRVANIYRETICNNYTDKTFSLTKVYIYIYAIHEETAKCVYVN